MSAIFERASVRNYQDRPVEDEKIELLLRAAMAAPSGGNQQPWEFVVCTDPGVNEQLGATSPYTKPAGRAPLNIVALYRTQGVRFPEDACQDMSAAVENILLEATELGLGGVWQGVWPVEERMAHIAKAVGAPEGIVPFALVSIGYPLETPEQKDRYDEARVHRNRYGQ